MTTPKNNRRSEFPIDRQFLDRWSPRAFDGTALPEKDLLTILEAAHWAPSSSNEQPWRFIAGIRGTPEWTKLFNLLVPANQTWVQEAGALLLVISAKNFARNGSFNRNHSFDAGSAWMSLALQALKLGYHAHGMAGLDYDRAPAELKIPDDHAVEAMVAIGRFGNFEKLPAKLQEREIPNERRPLSEVLFKGSFGQKW